MIRVKVELIPHGRESAASVLDEILIENDGTGFARGPSEGGVGNYNVFDNETIGHLNVVDYPSMYAAGFIKNVERVPGHRTFLAEHALGIVQASRELDGQGALSGPNPVPRPEKNFGTQVKK